jgi:hypothetical protein
LFAWSLAITAWRSVGVEVSAAQAAEPRDNIKQVARERYGIKEHIMGLVIW